MWPFKAKSADPDVLTKCAALERELHDLQLDVDSMWDQIKRLSNKLARRAKELEDSDDATGVGEAPDVLANGSASPTWSKLTPRQRQIQMSILNRRGNGGS